MKKFKYINVIVMGFFLLLMVCETVYADPSPQFATGSTTCSNLLGPNLTSLVRVAVKILQIAAAVIAIVKGMLIILPAVTSKDDNALSKALGTLAKLFIILALILLIPTIIKLIGDLFGFDVSCFF